MDSVSILLRLAHLPGREQRACKWAKLPCRRLSDRSFCQRLSPLSSPKHSADGLKECLLRLAHLQGRSIALASGLSCPAEVYLT
eukprot:5588565-Alexandrium_andersonii.AAC.1